MTPNLRRGPARTAAAVLVLSVAAATAACSSGGDSDPSAAAGETDPGEAADVAVLSDDDITAAMETPTELTFWTWVTDIENEVALFEEKYPAIDVEVVNAGQGADEYTKLRTALTAGSGAPDVAQIEYQFIPSFTGADNLLDLRPYGAAELQDQFVDWTWSQVTGADGGVYAYPQDTGPMGMLYREDILSEAGIEPPTTWEEFATAAATLNESNPDVYLTNIASNDAGAWNGLMWQAGSKPFTEVDSDGTVGISLDDDASRKVADYWGGLVADGVVATDPDFTDQWYQGLSNGTYATWLTAAWGPLFLSTAAEGTSGKWRAAPLPQWEGEPVAGNWGGSTSAVMATTKNPIAAAKLAEFINTDPESTQMLANEQFLFPANLGVLEDPDFLAQELDFYGGQQVNQVFSDISATVDTDFTWSPFQDQVFSDWNDTVGTALVEADDVAAATEEWQSRVVDFAETQGFTPAQ